MMFSGWSLNTYRVKSWRICQNPAGTGYFWRYLLAISYLFGLLNQYRIWIIYIQKILLQLMTDNLLLPIELTKILYESWQGQLQIVDDDKQLYGKSLNGHCKVTFKNGNRYEGDFKNGLLHGKGVFTWANGIVYEGGFKNNKLEGNGVYRWTDGAVYEGQVQNGLRHGHGKLTLDTCMYEGEWKNGHRHGRGKITFSNGGVYEGEFENGVKSGKGRMYYPSGNFYQGEWKNDAKNGEGTMKWMDTHQKYTGQWLDNLQHGFGVHIWLDGRGEGKYMRNRYEGEWKHGLRDGFGVFYYANGSKYQGEWKQNMKEGIALFTNQYGNTHKTQFSKDRLIKQIESSTILPSSDSKTKSSFIFNNKQIECNPYTKMFNLKQLYLPEQPNLDQLYNLLLRNNSQIKTWYKNLSLIFDSKSQLTFSLTLEGIWKILRNLRVLGKISLARVDRKLAENKLNLRNVVDAVKEINQSVPVQDVEYYVQANNLVGFADSLQKQVEQSNNVKNEFREQQNIHDGQKIILLRDFAYLLVTLSQMIDFQSQPHKSVQKCLDRIGPLLDSMSKNQRKSLAESKSENVSTLSKTQKVIPLYAKTINTNLFNKLTQSSKSNLKPDMEDRTIKFYDVIQLFREANIMNDTTDPAMLERFLDKNMDAEYLSSNSFLETKLNPKFSLVANYELIEFEFTELVFYYLLKKLPSTKQNEENKNKYNQFINKILQAFEKTEKQKKEYDYQNQGKRIIISKKLSQKQELIKKRNVINEIRQKEEETRREKEREERERAVMEANDMNVMSENFESEDQEYSEY